MTLLGALAVLLHLHRRNLDFLQYAPPHANGDLNSQSELSA